MNTLVIRKKKWVRGAKNGESSLLNSQGCMCCLGFLAIECGADRGDISGKPSPDATNGVLWPRRLLNRDGNNSALCHAMVKANDDQGIDDNARIKTLTPLFRQIGFRLVVKP